MGNETLISAHGSAPEIEPWSQQEVEAIVADYFEMLGTELSGLPYSKTEHRRKLVERLRNRSEGSVEFKHANISAILIELGFPYIVGYKPRGNYQTLLAEVVADKLFGSSRLCATAREDANLAGIAPEINDVLAVLTDAPRARQSRQVLEKPICRPRLSVNYLELEARNRSLGLAGEKFVIEFERARLARMGRGHLAERVEHCSLSRGDSIGFDILSFEDDGRERLIEVKTTKYGEETPFFASHNEVEVSESNVDRYYLYRLFQFRISPRLFVVRGPLSKNFDLAPSTFQVSIRVGL
ncbi:hypothetical protein DSM104443_01555 [Usitatibacter rugosus]|uniref:Protein NO VEIN C-terminal domain-containing protein n=1 Tax=Usitatibacter rugosus TaxID=2732067 RepID=A0A6M4GT95_9PROT|nr:DUF3883 domain-containing protein [Usitatibacter rugosus]QJR10491.1 hypothetical protein DSM104443_01555 [Usitatibacter rugosus]